MSRFGTVWEVLKVSAIVFITAVLIRSFVAQPFVVEGLSMEPDFHNGEYLLVEKISYNFRQPSRGDVVIFRYPKSPDTNYIKRVIGLPGETVRIFDDRVFINGTVLKEEYLAPGEKTVLSRSPESPYEVSLAKDQYFVMGDNRQHSSDSREWGPLDRSYIVGKSALVLYPRQNFSAIASPSY